MSWFASCSRFFNCSELYLIESLYCRYFTVMYFLADVEEGGETAFPLADMEEELYQV